MREEAVEVTVRVSQGAALHAAFVRADEVDAGFDRMTAQEESASVTADRDVVAEAVVHPAHSRDLSCVDEKCLLYIIN